MRFLNGTAIVTAFVVFTGLAIAGPNTGERHLSEDEIRAITSGKTFHYTLLDESRGDEHHFEDGRVTWALPDGQCMHGVWIAKEEVLCYFYGLDRYGCWNVVADSSDGSTAFRHSPVTLDGEASDSPSVYINRISEEPVSCAPQQLVHYSY